METVKETIYVAEDGKRFVDADECRRYEEFKKRIRYYSVSSARDLTETGCFCKDSLIAVYSTKGLWRLIVEEYMLKQYNGHVLSVEVMGYGITTAFEIKESDEKKYSDCKNAGDEHLFLTDTDLTYEQALWVKDWPIPENIRTFIGAK